MEISEPTLALHYRRQLDTGPILQSARSYARLLHIATTGSAMAAVKAELAILSRHAPGWVQTSKLKIEEQQPGLGLPGLIARIEADDRRRADAGEEPSDYTWPAHTPN